MKIIQRLLTCLAIIVLCIHQVFAKDWFMAVRAGDLKTVEALIHTNKTNIDQSTKNGTTALMIAAKRGHGKLVAKLLHAGARLDLQENKQAATALMLAAQKGYVEVMDQLIQAGAQVALTAKKKGGYTALMLAIQQGQTAAATRLIQAHAPLDVAATNGDTPLILAAKQGYRSILQKLLTAGADIDGHTDQGTPLMVAIKAGHIDVAMQLLAAGARSDLILVKTGETALSLAVVYGHETIVDQLLEQGIIVNYQHTRRLSPLSEALRHKNLSIAKRLIGAGARFHSDEDIHKLCLAVFEGQSDQLDKKQCTS